MYTPVMFIVRLTAQVSTGERALANMHACMTCADALLPLHAGPTDALLCCLTACNERWGDSHPRRGYLLLSYATVHRTSVLLLAHGNVCRPPSCLGGAVAFANFQPGSSVGCAIRSYVCRRVVGGC